MPPVTFTMIASWWQLEEGKTFSAIPVLERDISAHIKLAAVASEDQKFFEHYGFDFEAIRKAYRRNEKSRRLYGGSTISQQVAKNVFLWQNRSFIRKGLETGKGVFGAQSAAEVYLKKNSRQLTQSEAALIIASLPNPVNYRINKPSPGMQQRRDFILHK
ncbi:hypothetical protein CHS0354_026838 [Potamilus streckersoni]|uniref:Glycosyl transferase family 51 domain-containing protein n=1 Tax=Potamilus streckersoni TaxID=2493646 RepID=A0AAE0W875_9BIVA|nr:hypothetical protein CHS0354_026838 [Potamilus streckersoni]